MGIGGGGWAHSRHAMHMVAALDQWMAIEQPWLALAGPLLTLLAQMQGRIQRLKKGEGGGIQIEWGIGVARVYRGLVPRPLRALICHSQYVAQKPENEATYIEHAPSSWVSGGMLLQENLDRVRRVRVFLRPLETTTLFVAT